MINRKNQFLAFPALILLVFFGTLKSYSQCYELVWAEEFDYTGFPDPTIWNMEIGNNNGANSERQYYTRNDTDNCWVDSGRMVITAIKENFGGQAYTSARINTKGKAEFMYGKVEARLKLPYGQGIWPAFWMLGANIDQVSWPRCGEIDIMEMIGGVDPRDRTSYGTNHWADVNGNHAQYGGSKRLTSGRFADDFHIFSMEWNSQKTNWFLDGVQFATMNITPSALSEFHQKYFIILNLAVGGTWPGYPDATTIFPQKFEVDYVRVYKLAENEIIEGKDSVIAKEKNLSFSLPVAEGRQFLWSVPEGASLLTRADSNAVVVDWGCAAGELLCNITTSCTTSIVKSKNIGLAHPRIEGPTFYDQSAGNLFFFVPVINETDYLWNVPEGASFIAGDTSNMAEVVWGTGSGMVNLQITNSCGTSSISKKIYKYGQYPYPDLESPFVIPGTINSTDYDYGGEGVAYHDVDASNQGTGPREDERVDTENQPLFPNVGWISTGEWLEYTIKVPVSGYYRIEMKVASQNTSNPGPIRVLINGESRINDIAVPSTGAWTTFLTVSERLLYFNTTDTVLRIEAVKGGFNLGPVKIIVDNTVSQKDLFAGSGQIVLYPNPVKDVMIVHLKMKTRGDVKTKITDISGKQVSSGISKSVGAGEQKIIMSEYITSLHPGMYLIEINTTDQKYFSKFIKE